MAKKDELLTVIPFKASDIGAFRDVDCGDAEYAVEVADWIQGRGEFSVLYELGRGTRVWTYRNSILSVVGFASLGTVDWTLADGCSITIQYIPALGVFSKFQGQPAVKPRYSTWIFEHVLDQAEQERNVLPVVGLMVHPQNLKAISMYEKSGFERLDTEDGYIRMMLEL